MTRKLPPDFPTEMSREEVIAWVAKNGIFDDPEAHVDQYLAATQNMLQGRPLDDDPLEDDGEDTKATPETGPVRQELFNQVKQTVL